VDKEQESEQRGSLMLLRDHPLLTHRNACSWPPAWLYCGGFDNTHPHGEVGILKTVFLSVVKSSTRCSLIMEHAGAEYMGELLISDAAFCREIYEVLLRHCGKTIQEIGEIDLVGREPEHSTRKSTPLSLRNHPLMSYQGVPNWPPTWMWIDGREDKHPKGEVGILRTVLRSKDRINKCFLLIFHEESSYMGCLLFDDAIFCRQIAKLLQAYCNRPIAEIGSLDLTFTL
jgi:hypothetical protein